MGYIRKALEKGYLEHPGSACCTDDMFEIFVRFTDFWNVSSGWQAHTGPQAATQTISRNLC